MFKGKVCTDGSGGLYSSDNELRRCGWSAVQLQEGSPSNWPWIAAPLGGNSQTVPRAELTAVIMVVEYAAGDCQTWTDHDNVCQTINFRKCGKAIKGIN